MSPTQTFSRLSFLINSIEQLKKPPLEAIGKHLGRISGQHVSYKSNKVLLISQIVNAFQYIHRNHKSVFDRVYNSIRRGVDLGYTGTDFQSSNYYNTELNDILAIVQTHNQNNPPNGTNQSPNYTNDRAVSAYSSTINTGRSNPAYENYFNNINIERLVGFSTQKQQPEINQSLPSIDTILPDVHYDRNNNLGSQRTSNNLKTGCQAPFEGRFAPSPFYKIIKTIAPAKCIHASGSKSTVSLAFSLQSEDYNRIKSKSKLTHPDKWIGLRLLCGRQNNKDVNGYDNVEFPMVCEVRVNSILQKGNLKGIKNKPGTTAPPDITINCKIIPNVPNRIDVTYVNTSIDYFMSVQLVEELSVDSIALYIKQEKFVSTDQVRQNMFKSQNEDDIVTLQSSLSLKDPLTLARISVPFRSTTCNHVQCFDAIAFLSMNSQTPTWDCPICQKHIGGAHNLVSDGYFLEILNDPRTQDFDYVVLNPDGSWKTPSETTTQTQSKPKPKPKSSKTQTDSVAISLDVSDSEDEDYERIHKPPSNEMHITQPSPVSNIVSRSDVIDLTFSD